GPVVLSSRRRHTSFSRDWSSDVCSSDLGLASVPMPSGSPHIWLPMATAAAEQFARRALERGVRVTPPDAVKIGGEKSGGVRLCLMAPQQRSSLERALRILADIRSTPDFEIV